MNSVQYRHPSLPLPMAPTDPNPLLRLDGRDVESRPIKGTRRRRPGQEARARADLLAAAGRLRVRRRSG